MDEAALRAMMPASFGKRQPKRTQPKPLPPAESTSTGPSDSLARQASHTAATHSLLSGSLLGKRTHGSMTASRPGSDDEEDDGLTPEERAANAELERRIQERGSDSDEDNDDDDDDDDDEEIGPMPAPRAPVGSSSRQLAESSPPRMYQGRLPPVSSEAVFSGHHSKTISALAVDASGARFCVGSYDYTLSMYDFGGMKSNLAPFRAFEPAGSYPVYDLSFSSDSRYLLVVSGSSQAKVFTRDGAEVDTCRKGDPYLRDMRNTTGHISDLSCGRFHPTQPGVFATGGSDSTVRLWDVASMARGHIDIIVLKSKVRGNRTRVTAMQYSPLDGKRIYAAGWDGSLSFWDTRSNLHAKPRGSVDSAHEPETITSSIAVHPAKDNVFASRGGDGTVKLWDARSFRAPVSTLAGLPSSSAHTELIFDPFDGETLLTCTSSDLSGSGRSSNAKVLDDDDEAAKTSAVGGSVVALATHSGSELGIVRRYPVSTSVPVRLAWNSVTNQLFCTLRDGSSRVFYDVDKSTKGVIMAVGRAPKPSSMYVDPSVSYKEMEIYVPAAGDMPQSEAAKRRKLAKIRQDPSATSMPQRPVEGRGTGGRIGAAATQHVVQNLYRDSSRDQDPREALLRYADKDADPVYTKAYKDTQPERVFQGDSDNDDDDQANRASKSNKDTTG
ncbi:WD40 repeat-like protein [Testicularia cyperi]|uniref:WD40 repeat-like protein n=1 Tax=Testicularia cyperi TaxID=1882483 RepID=A0A317XLY9_9BASI|nr:WD40 repeat-like protein [Testicularia cyperi]